MLLEENQMHRLNRPVNILCADPGMGKTTMLEKLRNECDSRFWTIDVELKTHDEFFKTKHDANELLNHLIEGKENGLSKQIRNVFLSKKKVYFFFDGLDEIEKSSVDNVLVSVEKLSSEGSHVWISSRKHLKMKLEDRFQTVAMDMEEVEEEQQKLYIKKRLKEKYSQEQIGNLIRKIFNSCDIDNYCQVLDKEESKNPHLSLAEEEDILEKHEMVAVHSVFGEEVLKKLNLDLRRAQPFLNQIKTNKDPLGIVTKVNDEGKAVFEHFTYGEYFAARFLANNFEKARLIREELFSDGRKNLMMILSVILAEDNPLHLAVIYRNGDQIAKYIEDQNVYDKAGRNPLHLATYIEPRYVDWNGYVKKVKLLIDKGEIVNTVTNIGETPLHIAAFKGNVDIAELLIEKGASVNAITTAELLIKKGASLNALTDEELTPLHYAAFGGNSETVTLLIQKGACVNTPETLDTSLSPLFMAVHPLGNQKTCKWSCAENIAFRAMRRSLAASLRPDTNLRVAHRGQRRGRPRSTWWTKKDMFSSQHRQQRYHSNEQKYLALLWGIRKDRPYLEGRRFLVRYDSKAATWFQSVKFGTTKLTHWTLEHNTLGADDTERLFSPQQRRDRPDRGPGIRRSNSTFITSGTAGWSAPSQTPCSSTVSGNMDRPSPSTSSHEADMYLVDLWKNVLRYNSDQLCPIYRMFSKLRRSL
ncbi:hypothetical protein GEV33_010750 [Tenebrio molitor]|uniref:Reverse transcriptase RNase H-like domain-containing protein n=1 Tax=Tenebrio molitor TaxID=7067 RepID=A0A8J6HCR4_TENMO|nr:hypothetical protein GEV33_010750 [Tenebrio molitor]